MKFRAVAVGIERDGHPVQVYGADADVMHKVAKELAYKFQCEVRVYKVTEELHETVFVKAQKGEA